MSNNMSWLAYIGAIIALSQGGFTVLTFYTAKYNVHISSDWFNEMVLLVCFIVGIPTHMFTVHT